MANFVSSSVKSIEYARTMYKNDSVNIDLCTKIVLDRYKVYPDTNGAPCISFHMLQGTFVTWIYSDIEARDNDFHRIVSGDK